MACMSAAVDGQAHHCLGLPGLAGPGVEQLSPHFVADGDESRTPVIGQEVTLSIRPECWELSRDRNVERNSVRGKIGAFVYLGEVAQYELIVRDTTLKVFERNPRFVDGATRGEIFAAVEPEDVVVLLD